MSLIMKCNCIGLILNCVLLQKPATFRNHIHSSRLNNRDIIWYIKAFCSFLNEKYWSDTANTQGVYSVLWMCSETRWPTCSLSGKSTYWPHGLLPKSNYYTPHAALDITIYTLFLHYLYPKLRVILQHSTMSLFIQGHLLTLIIISVTL